MKTSSRGRGGPGRIALALSAALALAACGGQTELPSPRPLIIHSGARLSPDPGRMQAIDAWVQPELTDIRENPAFLIRTLPQEEPVYPWEGLSITADTANIQMLGGVPEARVPHMIYAHLHLMQRRGEVAEWLPEEAVGVEGFELERTILERTSDAWLYGRSVWDAPPHDVLDELMYARENGFLPAMIFTARPEAYPDARRAWVEENPGGIEEYRQWFVETFGEEPPGLRQEDASGARAGRALGPGAGEARSGTAAGGPGVSPGGP